MVTRPRLVLIVIRSVVAVSVLAVSSEAAMLGTAEAQEVRSPPSGSVLVDKVVVGDAGLQDDAAIRVQCQQLPDFGDASYDETQVVPAGTTVVTLEFAPIAAPADCTATEVDDGGNAVVGVQVSGLPTSFGLNPNEDYTIGVTNEVVAATGSLQVTKVSLGDAAGARGDVSVEVSCTDPAGSTTEGVLELPPGAVVSRSVGDLVTGSQCTVTEVDAGAPPGATVQTLGSPQTATITADEVESVVILNRYLSPVGTLDVVKIVEDPLGVRGDVAVDVVCDGVIEDSFSLPASAGEGTFPLGSVDVPADSDCWLVEAADGSGPTANVVVTPSEEFVTVGTGETETLTLTNEYLSPTPDPVDVTVTKDLIGVVGTQGPVLVVANCAGRRGVIGLVPGATTGDATVISDVPAGSTCTISEPLDGANAGATVVTAGTGTDLDASSGELTVTNTYALEPGSLRVVKEIDGSAAAERSDITIEVSCTDGSTTSQTFAPGDPIVDIVLTGIDDASTCTVTEPADGSTDTVGVTTSGVPDSVEVNAGEESTVVVENLYEPRVGALVVFKQIRGGAAEFRGDVELTVACDDGTDRVLSAAPDLRAVPILVTGLPVETECTVAEPLDGELPAVQVVTDPPSPQVVTIEEGPNIARVTNTYTAERSSLTVTKRILGDAELRGEVVVAIDCDSAATVLTVPVDGPPESSVSLDGLYPGETCSITETSDGANQEVEAVPSILPAPTLTIGPGAGEAVLVSNAYVATGQATPADPSGERQGSSNDRAAELSFTG
jgi:hypothetical protein